jgi:tetratricopeptide (TPR) repeat protein
MTKNTNLPDGFSFNLNIPLSGKQLTASEAEEFLLKEQEAAWIKYRETLFQLARFYGEGTGDYETAFTYLDQLVTLSQDLEEKAFYYLTMGQLMEQQRNYEAAAEFYARAFGLEPTQTDTWYLINNNLGFSLNMLGRCEEAEKFCHAAIAIDPGRHNAYKNLARSQQGQGQLVKAARNFVQAVKKNASDPRALNHLEDLVKEHPDLLHDDPDLKQALEDCRKAVDFGRDMKNGV